MAYTPVKETKQETQENGKTLFTLQEVREMAKFDIVLPEDKNLSNQYDQIEYVTLNGRITQIKRGERVSVSYPILEALLNSGRYDTTIIRN